MGKLFEKMSANPRDDWTINNIEVICENYGLECLKPSNGSHYTVKSKHSDQILTIPYKRPIKPIYIKKFVILVKNHDECEKKIVGDKQ